MMSDLPVIHNLFHQLAATVEHEIISDLLQAPHCRLERIVSNGQASPPDHWYDQAWDEWVILLSGAAIVVFAESPTRFELKPGDYVLIPAHCRHRVAWTAPDRPSVWLALHVSTDLGAAHLTPDKNLPGR